MDRLFAPWRIEWVERDEEPVEGCPFCVLPARDADREGRIVARNGAAFVILNNAPYNPGHAMVVPDRHTGAYEDLDATELRAHARLKQRTLRATRTAFEPDGLNVGLNLGSAAAGGSIDDHLHEHVVPRWAGDTNFMPVVGETKVIVEALDRSYDRLRSAFADQTGAHEPGPDAAVVFDDGR
jgi:ATP adenylyltransferase